MATLLGGDEAVAFGGGVPRATIAKRQKSFGASLLEKLMPSAESPGGVLNMMMPTPLRIGAAIGEKMGEGVTDVMLKNPDRVYDVDGKPVAFVDGALYSHQGLGKNAMQIMRDIRKGKYAKYDPDKLVGLPYADGRMPTGTKTPAPTGRVPDTLVPGGPKITGALKTATTPSGGGTKDRALSLLSTMKSNEPLYDLNKSLLGLIAGTKGGAGNKLGGLSKAGMKAAQTAQSKAAATKGKTPF